MNTYCNHETSYKAAHRFIPSAVFESNVSELYLNFYFVIKINILISFYTCSQSKEYTTLMSVIFYFPKLNNCEDIME